MTYQGWSNYETWAVKLWIDNEYEDYVYWTERTTEELDDADGDREMATAQLADSLKDAHEENTPDLTGAYSDLLRSALEEVDWQEIAEALIETAFESIKEEAS